MAIIGLSGKKRTGKDTVGKIIQYLTTPKGSNAFTLYNYLTDSSSYLYAGNTWKVVRFAGKLKQIVSLLTGCTLEDLENEEFKNKELNEFWWYYGFGDTVKIAYFDAKYTDKQRDDPGINKFLVKPTYRSILQKLGTEGLRDTIHPNVHINALFADYKGIQYTSIDNCPRQGIYDVTENDELQYGEIKTKYPDWIITDCRFVNEAQAIKERDGLLIRIENPRVISKDTHASETSLDNYQFDEVIINDSSIEDLVEKVKQVLIKHNIING